MFEKGSRYRNLSESSSITSQGERLRGKDLRLIPSTPGRFLHTVHERDRLDLLAFKYYGDPTKWWQICDANREFPFPADLLDRLPVVLESFILAPSDFTERLNRLLANLRNIGEVKQGYLSFFEGERPRDADFFESIVVVIYTPSPSTHQTIVDEINKEFHFLSSFAWEEPTGTAECFRFEDEHIRKNWLVLTERLTVTSGILEVQSFITEATLHVLYNEEMASRETILAQIRSAGFTVKESLKDSRVGAKIVIPPNQIV